jgi:phosphatidylinositol-bisphosphatase
MTISTVGSGGDVYSSNDGSSTTRREPSLAVPRDRVVSNAHSMPTQFQRPPLAPLSTAISSSSDNFQPLPRSIISPANASSNFKLSRSGSLANTQIKVKTADEETEDGRIRNREAAAKIRDAWIYKQIRARSVEFTSMQKVKMFVGTWNVNAKVSDRLEPWLCANWGPNAESAPDLVVVGFQEIVDLNAVNVAVDNKTQQRSLFWVEKIRSALHSRPNSPNFTLLVYKHLVGLLLCIFVKSSHHNRIKHLHAESVGVGVMGMMGNKGAVCVRLQFYDSTLCFVCSHLAAHRENVQGRNADYYNIMAKTAFDVGEDAVRESIQNGSLQMWFSGNSYVSIPDHDIVIWLGDLNYRIDESIPCETVIDWSNRANLEDLRVNDQLNIERQARRAFHGFQEGVLTFKPTYKYQPGTDEYDQRPEKKIRAPAWCDRILWMSADASHVQLLSYAVTQELNASDHKPVFASFLATIKDVIQPKREAVYGEVMKVLDKFENQSLPMVGLDRIFLDFGELRYEQTFTLPIRVTNTGKVVALFRFVPKLDEVSVSKPWISINPMYGMLIPGESETIIKVTVKIDNVTANALSTGREVLEDILILRLENGRDYYITVTGQYARSCFGMSVDELVMYAEPIRNIPLDPIRRAEYVENNISSGATAAALCVPKELWRVIDAIYQKGLHNKDLFTTSGLPDEMNEIRECLDTGSAFGEFNIHSMAETLISFLASLSSPIVPRSMFPNLEVDSQNMQYLARKFLEELPPIHYNVFVYIISFFRECLVHKESNLLSVAKLARICCNCLAIGLQGASDFDDSAASMQRRAGMQTIMTHFLETTSI